MQITALIHCLVIKITKYTIVLVTLFILFYACSKKNTPSLTAEMFKVKLQYMDLTSGEIQTKFDSICVYKYDPLVNVYEKYEEMMETKMKVNKGENNAEDTTFLEIIPTGKIKKYYYAYFKGSDIGYFFDDIEQTKKYSIGKVDSVNKTSPGTNRFPIDTVVLYKKAKFYGEKTEPATNEKVVKYFFPDANLDGDTIVLYFKSTKPNTFSLSPKLDSLYKMTLYNFTILMNEKYSQEYKVMVPSREFVLTCNSQERNAAETEKLLSFIKKFKTQFQNDKSKE